MRRQRPPRRSSPAAVAERPCADFPPAATSTPHAHRSNIPPSSRRAGSSSVTPRTCPHPAPRCASIAVAAPPSCCGRKRAGCTHFATPAGTGAPASSKVTRTLGWPSASTGACAVRTTAGRTKSRVRSRAFPPGSSSMPSTPRLTRCIRCTSPSGAASSSWRSKRHGLRSSRCSTPWPEPGPTWRRCVA